MIDLKSVGINCKKFRESRGYYQSRVADDTGYSIENVSAFEHGRNDNYRLLLWYIMHGMNISDLLGGDD
jgi:transcriptional regulator with XRE-family HTH domain